MQNENNLHYLPELVNFKMLFYTINSWKILNDPCFWALECSIQCKYNSLFSIPHNPVMKVLLPILQMKKQEQRD